MASFAQTLRNYRSGSLSSEALLQEIDRILAEGRASAGWMLETLAEDHNKDPLPVDLHTSIKERLITAVQLEQGEDHASAAPPSRAEHEILEDERTRMATAVGAGAKAAGSPPPAAAATPVYDPEDEALRIKGTGDILNNRFELEECIGSGGMSTVYKALDRRKLEANDRNPYVAVKILNLEFRSHPSSLIALQREAKKCQNLAHPNIVRVYDFDRDGATVYMTMEYLSGESLGRKIGASGFKGMPAQEALPLVNQIGKALTFAHECGIVHADFKPANVLITDSGEVKVIDFGIARAFQRADDTAMEATRFDPRSLGALTPTYASPEMIEQQEPDPRDDLYSLACTTYELLTGRHPFGRLQATAARDGGLHVQPQKGLSRQQFKALRRALAFDRDKRTPSVNQFLAELDSRRPYSAVAAGAGVAAVLTLVVGGLGYLYSEGGFQQPSDPVEGRDTAGDTSSGVVGPAGLFATSTEEDPPDPAPAAPIAARPPAQGSAIRSRQADPVQTASIRPEPTPPAPVEPPAPPSLASVTSLIARTPCSLIDTALEGRVVRLSGYATPSATERLRSELASLDGVSRVHTSITPIRADQCDLAEAISPYWHANRGHTRKASLELKGGKTYLKEGDDIILNLATPPYKGYVYVDYFTLDGGVLHMIPNAYTPNEAPANHRATIGDLGEWRVGPPFGREVILLLVSPTPLFDPIRPEYEKTGPYLTDLKKALETLSRQAKNEGAVADILLIETQKGG